MSHIFISYAREDQPWAEMLAQTLEGRGWSTFWDRTIPIGKTWRETIGSELDGARCVIVLWSKTSIESGWVQEEADDAKRRGVLVPILIDNVQPPIGFRSIQAAHLENWDGTEPTQAFRRLIADITALIGRPPKEAEKTDRQAEAEIERKAAEEHEWPRAKTALEAAKKLEEKAKRAPPSAPLSSQASPSAMPELREQVEHVSSEQPNTAAVSTAVPWRIIAGGAIILGVIAIVVGVWRPRAPVTPQPMPPVTSQDASAMKDQGDRYYFGVNASKDNAKAREWYEKAADKGSVEAMVSLGVLYANGQGAAQDFVKARELYEKAADKGSADAMYNLGNLYDDGHGVAQDSAKAREWYEKAADRGNVEAMFALGLHYDYGQGVAQDFAKAREWYQKAADKGDASAKVRLQQLPIR
jgi:TPR repeat protein